MFMHFQEIVDFISSRKAFGIKPGLDRMNRLLRLLGNPEKHIQAIHVAGTNGKGSTIQYIKKALLANEYRVGVFTSPSLSGLSGHLWCNNQEVDKREWIPIMNDIYPIIQRLDKQENHPTSFEIITAVAFVHFSKHVDIALIETGMGGRYDTTNCVQPILSIITNVSKDHTAFLGNNIEDIAYHKAGIIKKDTPVILGEIQSNILPTFQTEAAIKNTCIYRLYDHFTYYETRVFPLKQQFIWEYQNERHHTSIMMQGMHQVKNASLALMAITVLIARGFGVDWQLVMQGIHDTELPGRFETVKKNPTIIVDGAHNPAGSKSFISTVQTVYPDVERHLIFAAYEDKDVQSMLDILTDHFNTITLTSFADERAASAEFLYTLTDHDRKRVIPEWQDAVKPLLSRRNRFNGIYLITGSLAFIKEVRSFIIDY